MAEANKQPEGRMPTKETVVIKQKDKIGPGKVEKDERKPLPRDPDDRGAGNRPEVKVGVIKLTNGHTRIDR